MFYPTYVWIFIDWYLENWWITDNPSCIADGSVKPEDLGKVLIGSLSIDHFNRIEDEHVDEPNVGNIVSNNLQILNQIGSQ